MRKKGCPTDTPLDFELGDTAPDIQSRRREERKCEKEREEVEKKTEEAEGG